MAITRKQFLTGAAGAAVASVTGGLANRGEARAAAGDFPDYGDYDALGLADLVRRGEVTPTELLEEAIRRTKAVNPKINAVVYKHYDEARRAIAAGRLAALRERIEGVAEVSAA